MNDHEPKSRRPFTLLAIALVAWTGTLAWGAYLQLGDGDRERDFRKPLVFLASMGAFLAMWGFALWLRSRRK